MDFAFLPPEINSGRMYTGPGSGPLLAAAGSWDSLSAELGITAGICESVLSALTGLYWHGPASDAMAATVTRHLGWLRATAEQATQTAMQARAAAAAYELAHAMTVPPAAVAANRTQLAALIATNFFGQNSAAIAATEAQYGEYWAQDATAMSGYAAGSAAARQLTPFSFPEQTADPDGPAAQDAAVTSPVSQSIIPTDLTVLDVIQATGTTFSGIWKMEATPTGIIGADKDLGILPKLGTATAEVTAAPPPSGAASGVGTVTATLARGGAIGSMSVPSDWAAPPSSPGATVSNGGAPTPSGTGEPARMPGIPGMPGGAVSRATSVVPRYGARLTVMSRPPAAG
ncbi:PPE family protein [Mycobacterium heidelbergense]|uniref:PPE family protein n=1 Tax=Mycobacterium heidelbergense TaxID=53376 RepID=A0A1X0DPT0_MYCHE|nr:PPE family protein [Mycobacterium heidelbergense]MCV7052695.1 PPE family protein [Mycobacterium heidelbergense]ORA74406.1 PPE family protein [Mycobacterium heidelbergense]BBZ48983.1 PPE family protein [Mycobacterium heidelbergense]